MFNECPIKVGTLVIDADPYKAPELCCGYGIVVEIISGDYVFVCWNRTNLTEPVNIGFLEVVNESR